MFNYKGETSSNAVEKPSRYKLIQMIQINITRNKTYQHNAWRRHITSVAQNEKS